MISIIKRCLLAGTLIVASVSTVHADLIVVSPSEETVELGDQVVVDIFYEGDAIVGAFDFLLNFDSDLLSLADAFLSSVLGDAFFFESIGGFDFEGPGSIEISNASFLPDLLLALLQSDTPLLLATLVFDTTATGTSPLDLAPFVLGQPGLTGSVGDQSGVGIPVTFMNSSVTIIDSVSVPEPGTVGLLLTGVLLVGVGRRRSRRS